jgi:creatinine amidohydrolase
MSTSPAPVRWSELKPDDFVARRAACPVVYLPIGLCEPHGHVAALGLDLLKAEHFCDEAARRAGGVVAPPQGYTIHETGFHAPWLEETVGEANPLMAALPPDVVGRAFLYQLRAFANAGFRAIIAVSGHHGGSQADLRRVAAAFTARVGVPVLVQSDPEFIPELHTGDHAGRYELSQLMAINPAWVDLARWERQFAPGAGGRLAVNPDAREATVAFGRQINEAIITAIIREARAQLAAAQKLAAPARLTMAATEAIWREDIAPRLGAWFCYRRYPDQPEVTARSQWRAEAELRP